MSFQANLIDGRLSLTTPEGVRLLLTPAGAATRAWAWAWAIDLMIWLMAIWALAMVLLGSKVGQGVYLVLLFVSYWGYPILCEVYCGGRTLGKRIMGIEVVRADGLPVGWRESALRNLMLVADFLPAMYFAGLLSMLFDGRSRRLGDIVAGTQVVYTDKGQERSQLAVGVPPLAAPFPLTPEQQRALVDLFEREKTLSPERLEELGSLAEPLTGLTGAASLQRLRGIVAGLT
ncbi:putative RDD family membrane protein YckC [Paucimonas lemoignei]|uniref:Putative RDD family membrane protein YckC n=1 Tax=Paucimonas lemoignei TaxID=29443 RepID=A0A4R3HW71_PAULE|nr:RDD family protein [Paucimonas lemoignei]TCS37392.1 putative RDD family membrane protein YckC [Paucimonas lemoignei]